jgi:hypothetical protein
MKSDDFLIDLSSVIVKLVLAASGVMVIFAELMT